MKLINNREYKIKVVNPLYNIENSLIGKVFIGIYKKKHMSEDEPIFVLREKNITLNNYFLKSEIKVVAVSEDDFIEFIKRTVIEPRLKKKEIKKYAKNIH